MTRNPAPPRLPDNRSDGTRAGEIVRGLLALIAIGLIIVGVPYGLWTAFGAPWPSSPPSREWLYVEFDARMVLDILVAVVWLAWLHFVVCLLVEAGTEMRGRGLPTKVPGGSVGTQPLARRLVATAALIVGGMTATVPAATAAAPGGGTGPDSGPQTAAVQSFEQRSNQAGAQAQVNHLENIHDETPGSVVNTANGVVKLYAVQAPEGRNYDCLWDIAERYLGSGLRYKELVELNRGRLQPDGSRLRDPDLIMPGWVLVLPEDAEGPGIQVQGDNGLQTINPSTTPLPSETDTAPGGGLGDAAQQATASDGSGDDGWSETASIATATGVSTGGAFLAAGLLYALRRRRGFDGGPGPRGGGRPLETELALREASDDSSAALVNRAVRSMGPAWQHNGRLPAPTSMVLGRDGLVATFPADAEVSLSDPWHGDPQGRYWTLRRDDAADLTIPTGLSPMPGLVPLGRSSEVEMMIDLESVDGLVSIGGDLAVARSVAVAAACSVATARWSDRPRVSFVGFADDLTGVAPDAIRHYDSLERALDGIEGRRRRQASACAAHGFTSVRAARGQHDDPRLWGIDLVVLSGVPSPDDLASLAALASEERSSVAVLIVGDVPDAAARMVVSSEGQLWCGTWGIDVLAHRLDTNEYRDLLDLFDAEVVSGERRSDGMPASADGVPVVDPRALDLSDPMPVEIHTFGDVRVSAPGPLDEARRDAATEIVAYLALHPEGVHPNVLTSAVWPRGISDALRDSALQQVGAWLGTADDGQPRLRQDDQDRVVLTPSGVRYDWAVLKALVNRSVESETPMDDLEKALRLAAAGGWQNLPAHRYAWLARETVEADMAVAVVAVAGRLATLAEQAGDADRSRRALQHGLSVVPQSESLWRDALRLAARNAGDEAVAEVARDMYATLRAVGSPRGAEPETDALVDELLPDFRTSAA